MTYAVELYLDKAAEKEISKIAEHLPIEDQTGGFIPRKRVPHVTLAMFNDVDEAKAEEKLKRLVRQWHRSEIRFQAVGFTGSGILFLIPVLNDFLFNAHLQLHEILHFSTESFEEYSFGNWTPHLTLARYADSEDSVLQALKAARRDFAPISGFFERVSLVRLGEECREVCSFKLRA